MTFEEAFEIIFDDRQPSFEPWSYADLSRLPPPRWRDILNELSAPEESEGA